MITTTIYLHHPSSRELTVQNWRNVLRRTAAIEGKLFVGCSFKESILDRRYFPDARCSVFECSTGFQLELLHTCLGELCLGHFSGTVLEKLWAFQTADKFERKNLMAPTKQQAASFYEPDFLERMARLNGVPILLVAKETAALDQVGLLGGRVGPGFVGADIWSGFGFF